MRERLLTLRACGGIEDVGLGLRWNAEALNGEVLHRAAVLARMGLKPGSLAAIGHGGTAHFFADLLACWHVGAAVACLDPSLTPSELRNVLSFARPTVFLAAEGTRPESLDVPIVNLSSERPNGPPPPPSPVTPEARALVLFTSGTTGSPKGVVLTFRSLAARISANVDAIGVAVLKQALVSLPTHFGHGLIGNSLTPLFAGGNIVLYPLGIPMANDLGQIIDQHGITFMSSVPSVWRLALGRGRQPVRKTLLRIHVGSAPFPAALWAEVATWSGAEVVNCYGTTETANWISGASANVDGIADGLVGRMWGGCAAVLDDNGQMQDRGHGELLIKSPSLMSGYLDRPDLTASVLHQGWYRTGDRGSIDQEGRLWLTGRLKDEINRAGFKVQPAELDALLERNPAVAEACVFGMDDPLGGEAVAAAIRLKDGARADPQSLQDWCRERLRREAVPEKWFFVPEIPRTSRGKVSRDAVRRTLTAELASTTDDEADLPANISSDGRKGSINIHLVRAAVENAWTKILGRDSFVAGLTLPETDADSLDVMRFWLLIEKALAMQLSMEIIDSAPTPNQLIAELEQQLLANGEPPNAPLVFLIPPARGDLPALARFRAALKGKTRFVLIQHPNWREMIEAGGGFHALADAAVKQISARCCENDRILLAGYSFGGLVAIETARRLLDRGHAVGFVGLIDTRAVSPLTIRERIFRFFSSRSKTQVSPSSEATGIAGIRHGGPPSRWYAVISGLILISAFRTLKFLGRLMARLLPEKEAITLDWEINWRLRNESLRRLRLKSLDVPVVLFRSDDDRAPSDYGWGRLIKKLKVIHVGGSHGLILTSPVLEILCVRFQAAVDAVPALNDAFDRLTLS